MKPGTIVELPDGRKGTTVYHNIDGYGIIFGEQIVDPENLPEPEALLREEYKGADYPCVGEDYRVLKQGSFNT